MSFLSKNNKDKNRGRIGHVPVYGEDGLLIDSGTTPGGGGGGFDGNPLHWLGKKATVFNHGCALGDSITEGLMLGRDPVWNTPNMEYGKTSMFGIYSYPSAFEKLTNVPLYNAGISGVTSEMLLNALTDASSAFGAWGEHGWRWQGSGTGANTLDGSKYDFFILSIGINDIWNGVNTNTISTNINSIITWARGGQTDSNYYKPVFLCTIPPFWYKDAEASTKAKIDELNTVIRGYASAINHVFVIDLARYSETADKSEYFFDHLTALGYNKLGTEIANGVSYEVAHHTAVLKYIQHFLVDNLEDIPETYLSMVEHEYSFVDENFERKA